MLAILQPIEMDARIGEPPLTDQRIKDDEYVFRQSRPDIYTSPRSETGSTPFGTFSGRE